MDAFRFRTRAASSMRWFQKYVIDDPKRHSIWLATELGTDGWLKATPSKIFPQWAWAGNCRYKFRCWIKAYANRKRAEFLNENVAPLPEEFSGPENSDHDVTKRE